MANPLPTVHNPARERPRVLRHLVEHARWRHAVRRILLREIEITGAIECAFTQRAKAATLFQFNEYRGIELSIAESLASFFPPHYDNRLDLVRVQFVSVIQDSWSASFVGHLNDRRFVVDLDRQADSRRRQSPVFEKHDGVVHLNPRHHRRPVSTRAEEYACRE